MDQTFYRIFELIGTIAFSVSGAAVALRKNMDIFGIVILGLCTAFGGGILRDLVLGSTPPAVFQDPVYAGVSVLSSLILFIPGIRRTLHKHNHIYEQILLWMDSIGLGVFTVIGIQCALHKLEDPGFFLLLFVGMITGVGGGVLRDVLAGQTPFIFIKHFYACASLCGAAIYILLLKPLGVSAASTIGGISVVILRICAAAFRWHLPKASGETDWEN